MKRKKATILVTGCAGFIGSHLCESLLANRYIVIGIDNFDLFYSKEIKLDNMISFQGNENFYFREADIRDAEFYSQLPLKPETIIDLAGKSGVRPSIENPQEYIDSNVKGTLNILEYMRQKGITKLIFGSSSSVYGNSNEPPYREADDTSSAISPYAVSKRSVELMNYTYHQLYGFSIINLRFFTVYGPRQRPDLAINKFFTHIENKLPIPLYGAGDTLRDYTYVADIVSGIEKAIELVQTQGYFDTINVGNHNPVRLIDLVREISTVVGEKVIIDWQPKQAGDVKVTCADTTRAEQNLKFRAKFNLLQGLKLYYSWRQRQAKILNKLQTN